MGSDPITPAWADPSRWDQPPDLFSGVREDEDAELNRRGAVKEVSFNREWWTWDGYRLTRDEALDRLDKLRQQEGGQ